MFWECRKPKIFRQLAPAFRGWPFDIDLMETRELAEIDLV